MFVDLIQSSYILFFMYSIVPIPTVKIKLA